MPPLRPSRSPLMDLNLTVTVFQTASTLLVAVLLRLLAHGVPGRFLHYWSAGWASLAVALLALNVSVAAPAGWPERTALAVYFVCEYGFGFGLWAGCRGYARGAAVVPADWWLFAPAAAVGAVGPFVTPDPTVLLPFHAGVFGGFCVLAVLATRKLHPPGWQTTVGLRLVQAGLVGLGLLFWHYSALMGWTLATDPHARLYRLHFSPFYDAFIQTLLALGIVVLATDLVRRELEDKNRQLAEASDLLAVAARTDPLTGLLNRRAFDGMLAERADAPFSGSVAVLDLNYLKEINDRHGHKAGDAAIQLTARALRVHFRITDPVFRTGGDEFLAVLEGGRAAELAGRLASMEASLRNQRLPGVPGAIDLEVAWGMADFETAAELPDAVTRADHAMYDRKSERKRGRVRTV